MNSKRKAPCQGIHNELAKDPATKLRLCSSDCCASLYSIALDISLPAAGAA
jgi:hypothetical protein